MLTLVVTTSRRPDAGLQAQAGEIGRLLGAPVVPRGGRSIAQLMCDHGVQGAIVVRPEGAVVTSPALPKPFFFHPNMAKVRIKSLSLGRGDPMVEAMDLHEGEWVLDCTLGRGSDAIVAAHVVGPSGRVLGLEIIPAIATLVSIGLQRYETDSAAVNEAMRRVEVLCADHAEVLARLADRSFHVVYFDPLFTSPVMQSQAMAPLRALARGGTVTAEVLEQAARVASRRVVIKDSRGSPLWERLGITQVEGGKGSRVEYGVVAVGEVTDPEETVR
jgi:16S rRNA (guanine1516-N2)-methyltransferase